MKNTETVRGSKSYYLVVKANRLDLVFRRTELNHKLQEIQECLMNSVFTSEGGAF